MSEKACKVCNRKTTTAYECCGNKKNVTSIYVVHAYYGCDTGCCGHVVYGLDKDGREAWTSDFHFDHPYSNREERIKEFILELAHDEFPNFDSLDIKVDYSECEARDC